MALGRAPVCAVFLDEGQRLNPPEQGTVEAFTQASRLVGKTTEQRQLSAAVRCRGGQPYLDWVEAMLHEPQRRDLLVLARPRLGKYLFQAVESAEELLNDLRQLRDSPPPERVAMVASFTESPGSIEGTGHPDNLRLGYPLTSGWDRYRDSALSIRWLMRPDEYVRFWLNGKSSDLDRVASIYGAQGFEGDYIGVVWGRDLVFRGSKWVLGDPSVCYDTVEGLISKRGGRTWGPGALDLLISRYRIFLTRGIKGTMVFAEDAETHNYLRSLTAR